MEKNTKKLITIVVIIFILLCGGFILINKNINDKKVLESKLTDLELKVSTLNSEKDDLNDQITSLEKTISVNEETISTLKDENNKVYTLQKENTNLKNQITSLNNQINEINTKVSSLENEITSLKQQLNIEKETYIVFYSVNNEVIYQERVKKGENVKNVPSSPIDETTVIWQHDGKNIQSDMVIHGTIYCTITFGSATDSYGVNYATVSVESIDVPYNTVLEFTENAILIDGEEIVTSEKNDAATLNPLDDSGWGIYEEGELIVKTSGTYKVTGPQDFYAYYGGCILKGTKITMASGDTKNVEDLVKGDKILSYDFFEGEMVSKELIGILKTTSPSTEVITIELANGSTLRIADMEYVFDADNKKYYLVTRTSYEDLLGTNILVNNNGTRDISKVVSVSLNKEATEHYTLFVEDSSNYIASNILTRSYTYWLNDYFTFTDDYKIDLDQLDLDIAQYGLYTYDEVKDYVSYDIFERMNLKYAKFVAGKGIATNEYVLETLSMLEYEITEGNKRFDK